MCHWSFRWKGQVWAYTYEKHQAERLIQQVYRDSRKVDGGFPEVGPLKRLVRDRVSPGRALGHIDRAAALADPAAPTPSVADPAASLAEAVADVAGSAADHSHRGS